MAEVVQLGEMRRHLAAKKGFEAWVKRFHESFDENTCAADLSDQTLRTLIQAGDEASMFLYELIMGVKGLGKGPRFHYLDNEEKMMVMDVALFLLDQLRFEAMRRLGWVVDHSNLHVPLLDLVSDFQSRYAATKHVTPSLSAQHPGFEEYEKTFVGDQGAFVRKLIPAVIETFGRPNQDDANH